MPVDCVFTPEKNSDTFCLRGKKSRKPVNIHIHDYIKLIQNSVKVFKGGQFINSLSSPAGK